MQLLDGKQTAVTIREELKHQVESIRASNHRIPHLAAVLVGNDGGSETYVNAKMRDCQEIGFRSSLIRKEASISEQELLDTVDALNRDPDLDGFIVQLPLPDHIDSRKVIDAIDPVKDVDGFHPVNFGRMALGLPSLVSATPMGIVELLDRYNIPTKGAHVVVLGRSQIVGLPISILLGQNTDPGNCTVTLTHSRTQNLAEHCRQADILIAAIGRPGFVTADMVKEGAVVIDVGTTRVPDASRKSGYRLRGDVDFEAVAPQTSYITPVPGGVGPMTRSGLLLNLMKAYNRQNEDHA